MAQKAKMTVDRDFRIGEVDKRIYGSFIEHLGRAVYTGIYEPGHKTADELGFRQDVIDLVRELNVPIVRYPGGNYVSNFYWEDSVGPKEERKPRLDLAWRTYEPNTVGINEFSKWAKKANTNIMMAVNLGTRGTSDALNLLEYCNLDTRSKYADLRRAHGDADPYGIKLWCMGNEMDGPWQFGHKNAREYGHLAAETSKAMKTMDHSIETVVCGSSNVDMPTFGTWEAQVLDEAYEYVDYVSLHQYWGNPDNDTAEFFAATDDLEYFLRSVIATCDYVRGVKHSKKTINLSFDEWNVWYHSMKQDNEDMENLPWRSHPHLLEDVYNYEDAIVDALALIKFLQHADRVKVACLAQLVNVIAPIMTEENGPAWRQTIFYPFYLVSRYGRGTALQPVLSCGDHATSKHDHVSDVEAVSVYNGEKEQLAIFAVNRNTEEPVEFEADLRGFAGYHVADFQALEGDDMKAVNTKDCEKVRPIRRTDATMEGDILRTVLKPASFVTIVLEK
ncbi:MAG: alpha-N-arabinofuranosidase [Lachnospiraceae bacterium]